MYFNDSESILVPEFLNLGSLKTVLRSLQCRSEDEVFLEGGLTGVCCTCTHVLILIHSRLYAHTYIHTQGSVPAFACKFSKNGLHGNLLAIADEEGSVRLMDTRRPASKSFIKGTNLKFLNTA